ncbi:MAG: flagellar export protein FliJ [Candidatus Latescibacteria bacterium]|nr:flagellar export protein FliJ [Candidatus Latescibacterota bacterium]
MRRFNFRLQKVMEFKEHKQKENERKLAGVKQELHKREGELSEMNNRKDNCQQRIVEKNSSHINVPEMQAYYLYLVRLTQQIREQMKQIWRLQKDAEDRRKLLLKSVQEKEMLKKLRDRYYLSYRRELERSEQKQLDEIASIIRNDGNSYLTE